jgi:menaquinone-dependent protoporphyrinogen oxidase
LVILARILLSYSTVDGQTLKISQRLQHLLVAMGHTAELVEVGSAASLDLSAFDQVVIGASIRYGNYRPELYRFIEAHRDALEQKPSAFFSVNVVARKPGRNTPESNPYTRTLKRNTTWVPKTMAVFAGKIDYQRYGFFDRQMIRLIMWLTKGPTDPTACVEFTDWSDVERFAQRVGSGAQ